MFKPPERTNIKPFVLQSTDPLSMRLFELILFLSVYGASDDRAILVANHYHMWEWPVTWSRHPRTWELHHFLGGRVLLARAGGEISCPRMPLGSSLRGKPINFEPTKLAATSITCITRQRTGNSPCWANSYSDWRRRRNDRPPGDRRRGGGKMCRDSPKGIWARWLVGGGPFPQRRGTVPTRGLFFFGEIQ